MRGRFFVILEVKMNRKTLLIFSLTIFITPIFFSKQVYTRQSYRETSIIENGKPGIWTKYTGNPVLVPTETEISTSRILRHRISQGRTFLKSPTFDVKMGCLGQYFINFKPKSLLFTHFG